MFKYLNKKIGFAFFKQNLPLLMPFSSARMCESVSSRDKGLWTPGMNEGNGLFNDAINTFYLRLYGVRHMVKDHSDSERENPLPPLYGLHLEERKKGNGLFNDVLNTFYLRLYGVRHMVNDNSDSERGNPLLPLHGLHLE